MNFKIIDMKYRDFYLTFHTNCDLCTKRIWNQEFIVKNDNGTEHCICSKCYSKRTEKASSIADGFKKETLKLI